MASTVTDRLLSGSGVAFKAPCRVATTANITLSGEQTIDGVAVVAEDRVLVRSQTTGADNGIYICKASAWERAPDWDGSGDVVTGTLVFITHGSTLALKLYRVSTTGSITIGTTSVAFSAAATFS
jgi:hypothetical protein